VRGYAGDDCVYDAAQRLKGYVEAGQIPVVAYYGDFDRAGSTWSGTSRSGFAPTCAPPASISSSRRVALTREQPAAYHLAPNTAKPADGRSPAFVAEYGPDTFEVDALPFEVRVRLLEAAFARHVDPTKFTESQRHEQRSEEILSDFVDGYSDFEREAFVDMEAE